METNFNDIDDEREYLARRARRKERVLRERRRRQKQRFMMLLGLMLCLAVVLIVGAFGKKSKADGMLSKTEEKEQLNEMPGASTQETATEAVPEVKKETPVYEFKENGQTSEIYGEEVISTHGILIDESTDTIVASKGAKDRISPASMTKVLTVLVAAENMTEEQLEDTFTMTLEITDYSYVNDCSNVGFLDGELVKVKDLFYGTILPSGGDAAVGLATYVAGSHEAFVELMNEKLDALGLSDTAHFTNCVGLYDANHYCTVYDMAVIMKAALQNDLCKKVLGEKCYTTSPTTEHPEGITISNWFLRRIEDKETSGEVLGAKTGFVAQSGNCAVSYSISDAGTPYICVTAGSASSWRCIYDHVEIYNRYVPKTTIEGENDHS